MQLFSWTSEIKLRSYISAIEIDIECICCCTVNATTQTSSIYNQIRTRIQYLISRKFDTVKSASKCHYWYC